MGAVATYNHGAFVGAYPEYETLPPASGQAYFDQASLYWANDGTGPVTTESVQRSLLYLLVAHIASLNFGVNGQAPSGIVGRVSQATEGSVSVKADLDGIAGAAAWFAQSNYGLQFWQATAAFRTMRYFASPGRNDGPLGITRFW